MAEEKPSNTPLERFDDYTSDDTPLKVSGNILEGDTKYLRKIRPKGTIGPITLYYAGALVSIISISMSNFIEYVFAWIGLGPNEHVTLFASIMAVMAGISWFLIFIRWSYGDWHKGVFHHPAIQSIDITACRINVAFENVCTHIQWSALQEIRAYKDGNALIIKGAQTILIPDRWFSNEDEKRRFYQALMAYKFEKNAHAPPEQKVQQTS